MVRPEVIRKRLNKLDDYISVLMKLQEYSFNRFQNDPLISGSTERYLHLAIEALLDMGNHVISDNDLGVINQYRDIPQILCDKNIINEEMVVVWNRMIGFRNTLVHDYADIDDNIVYDVLNNHLDEIQNIRKIFIEFL